MVFALFLFFGFACRSIARILPIFFAGQRIQCSTELLDVININRIHGSQHLSVIRHSPPPDKKVHFIADISPEFAQFINQRVLV